MTRSVEPPPTSPVGTGVDAPVDTAVALARRWAKARGAELVVFGHTHREALTDRYANTGSFAWPGDAPGRPYLEIVQSPAGPRAIRHHLTP